MVLRLDGSMVDLKAAMKADLTVSRMDVVMVDSKAPRKALRMVVLMVGMSVSVMVAYLGN
jgi:hypothetical protein